MNDSELQQLNLDNYQEILILTQQTTTLNQQISLCNKK